MISVGVPSGPQASTCGYCSPSGERSPSNSFRSSAGLDALQLSSEVYQMMIDRGWRRSGTWCYKPHLRSSCCPPYTIKLDAMSFKPSKHHKKLLNRWNNFVHHGSGDQRLSTKGKGKNNAEFDLVASVHASEFQLNLDQGFQHNFEMKLEHSSYTDEKYELFKKYQTEIHHDPSTPGGFRRFLVTSPLRQEAIQYSTANRPSYFPTHYGSYHWCYRLDKKLIAVSVIDILPGCVSSVYFMYDKDYESHSLGKLSALREIALTQELCAAVPSLRSLYLGFYIHSCQKMRYKGEYQPSYLCDPETYQWYPLVDCTKLLVEYRYACFSHPEHSLKGEPEPDIVRDYEEHEPQELDAETFRRILVVSKIEGAQISVVPANLSPEWNISYSRQELLACVEALGVELSAKILFQLE